VDCCTEVLLDLTRKVYESGKAGRRIRLTIERDNQISLTTNELVDTKVLKVSTIADLNKCTSSSVAP
jgi:hypothetical protein